MGIVRYVNPFTSLRGRIVSWYVLLLATLLFGLCVVQTVTLTGYLRSAKAQTMQQSANAALALVGPCFIHSSSDLRLNAGSAAVLLGSNDFATSIVTPRGQVLARYQPHSGTVGRSLQATPATVRDLVTAIPRGRRSIAAPQSGCRA